jgi:hypothetical protein
MGSRRNYLGLVSLAGVVLFFSRVNPAVSMTLMIAPWPLLGLLRWVAPPAPKERVVIDGLGVTRELRGRRSEKITWANLIGVDIVTTAEGPFADDFFFVLHAADSGGCAVANTLGGGLLERLQRLPRFDNMAVILASSSTADARFVCWTGAPGEALVAAAPVGEKPRLQSGA